MPKPELTLINQPVSTNSRLFEESGADKPKDNTDSGVKDVFTKGAPEIVNVPGQIAGRVPASNGAFGLVHGIDANLGAGMRVAIFRGLKDIGLGFVETLYDNAGGDFDGPLGTAIALKYKEKNYESGSRYIREDEVRKACDDAFRREGRDVIWVESEGISEVGGGTGGTLPIGALADMNANLKLSGIIRYRRLEPYECANGTLLQGQALVNAANVPITATLARRMPPGGEFEITGEGQLSFVPEVSKPLGLKNEGASLGATARLGGKVEVKGETTISVQRLPFGDEVLVKIAHAKSSNADVGASLKAGLELNKKAYEKLPELGRGVLKFLLDRMGLPDAPAFVKNYVQSQIQIKSRYERRGSEISRFVFDLSKPEARKAYEDIFTRLSLGKTKALISANDASVRSQRAGEKAIISERGIAATIGKTKLLLLSALQAEREGNVSLDGRASVVYRDCKFEKTYVNWIFGEKKIKWEAVSVDKGQNSQKQNYFHLAYSNCDRITEESQIEKFLRFARSLGIQTTEPERVAKVLADRDDTEMRVDMYFTNNGIKRIAKASKEECQNAYLKADADLSQAQILPSSKILAKFQQIANMWFFVRIFYWGEISRLREEYTRKSKGRNIDSDAELMSEAAHFAQNVGKMAQDDEKSMQTFFMQLAKASGFEFMRKIAALTNLAQKEESILHELSIAGGGLTLGAVDEGEILHPEKAMNRMLTKIA
jgi:hypothetical protein